MGAFESFSVSAAGLDSATAYEIKISYSGNASRATDCGDSKNIVEDVSGDDSYSLTFSVYGCGVGTATISASVVPSGSGSAVATATSSQITVVQPPTISLDSERVFIGQSPK